MTITDALRKLLTKFGGDVSTLKENATSGDIIDAISDAYTDKEGTHVEVSSLVSEGTKIATITTNNTEHDIYAPNGGSASSFDVTISYDETNSKFVSNKTFSQISEAFNGGSTVRAIIDMSDYHGTTNLGSGYIPLTNVITYDGNPFNFVFSTLYFREGIFDAYGFIIYEDSGNTEVTYDACIAES